MSSNRMLIFDARCFDSPYTGLSRYTYFLLESVVKGRIFSEMVILVGPGFEAAPNYLYQKVSRLQLDSRDIKIKSIPFGIFSIKNYIILWRYCIEFEGFEFFYPHFNIPFFVSAKKYFVIHDLFPLKVRGYFVKNSLVKCILFYLMCFVSLFFVRGRCISVSHSTKRDICRWFPLVSSSKIKVVHSASCLSSTETTKGVNSSDKPFLFYVGDRRPHKNLRRMVDIFIHLREFFDIDLNLVIAGSTKNYDFQLENYVRGRDDVLVVGRVTDPELIAYYNSMFGLFFISKYEGFGLPVLEAAQFSKPIICSSCASFPEIAPPGALLLDLESSDSILAERMYLYLADNISECKLDYIEFVAKFNWSTTSRLIFE